MTRSALGVHAASVRANSDVASCGRLTAHLLPESGDATDRLEGPDGIGAGSARRSGAGHRERIADVEQHFEQQLLALIRGVEVSHEPRVGRLLRAVVGLAVHGVEIVEDLLTLTWHDAEATPPPAAGPSRSGPWARSTWTWAASRRRRPPRQTLAQRGWD